jgi:hypothetical protein
VDVAIASICHNVTMNETAVRAPAVTNQFCDRCGARAAVIVAVINGDLYFCGHHARKHITAIVEQSLKVYDPNHELILG